MKIQILYWLPPLLLLAFVIWKQFAGRGSKEEIQAMIDSNAYVIDVRTPQEFSAGHFPGAVNIPLNTIEGRMKDFEDRGRSIIVYCASGNRSSSAKRLLDAQGFTQVANGGGLSSMMQFAKQ